MENEFRIIDIILSVILIVVMCVGIGMCFVKAPTMSGEMTKDNYQKYFNIRTVLNTVGNGMEVSLVFSPNHRYDLANVTITIGISGRSINSQTLKLSFSATYNEPYIYKEMFGYYQPSYDEAMSGSWSRVDYEVISVSGQFVRSKVK